MPLHLPRLRASLIVDEWKEAQALSARATTVKEAVPLQLHRAFTSLLCQKDCGLVVQEAFLEDHTLPRLSDHAQRANERWKRTRRLLRNDKGVMTGGGEALNIEL